MNSFLENILSQEQYKGFIKAFKSNEPFFIESLDSNLDSIPSIQKFNELEALKESWNGPVDVHDIVVKDESKTITTNYNEAIAKFKEGCGLLFNDINNVFEELNSIIDNIKFDLGVPSISYGRSLIYATPKNGGSATHFDQNFNIIFQLSGNKNWKLAKNDHVENPLTRYALGGEIDPEMYGYLEEELPSEVDDFEHSYDLKAGSFLFVPIGHWHNTQAYEDSVALNFTFTVPSWAEILMTALKSRLISSKDWRVRPNGINNKSELIDNIDEFQKLINTLAQDIPNWDAGMILSMIEGRDLRE